MSLTLRENFQCLENSPLFSGIPSHEIAEILENTSYYQHLFDKGNAIFLLMEDAFHVGIILDGYVQAQKAFPSGSQVNVSLRGPGELIGAAAVFSTAKKYPCDVIAATSCLVMMFRREDLLQLMQRDVRIMENLMTELASNTYMLQQRLELLSYSGIAQKTAFWLLTQVRQIKELEVMIPQSVSNWAMILNVSRPSLHRELKKMEEQGIIAYKPPLIEVVDLDALKTMLGML